MALWTYNEKSDSSLNQPVMCQLLLLFWSGTPQMTLNMFKLGLKITLFFLEKYCFSWFSCKDMYFGGKNCKYANVARRQLSTTWQKLTVARVKPPLCHHIRRCHRNYLSWCMEYKGNLPALISNIEKKTALFVVHKFLLSLGDNSEFRLSMDPLKYARSFIWG